MNYVEQRMLAGSQCGMQVLMLFIAALLLPVIAHAQDASSERSPGSSQVDALKVKLSVPNPGACTGSLPRLEMELTNVSNEEIKVGKNSLWDRFSYRHTRSDGSPGGGGGYGSSCSNCPEEIKDEVVLAPGMTNNSSHVYQLDGSLFHAAGDYTIFMSVPYKFTNTLDQPNQFVVSNKVRFELYHCQPEQLHEAAPEEIQTEIETAPLKVKLGMQKRALCVGSPIRLEMELTNAGAEQIRVDDNRLWISFNYTYLKPYGDLGGSGGTGTDDVASLKEITLWPGMTYRSSHDFHPGDHFFQKAGRYTINVNVPYNLTGKPNNYWVNSNTLQFEFRRCQPKPKLEEQK